MQHRHQLELERLGLSEAEAQIYLTLLKKGGTWKATAIAATLQTARSTAYEAINSLKDRGLLEGGTGYAGRFSAVPAERALPALVAAEREELAQRQHEIAEREQVADELAQELKSVTSLAMSDVGSDMIEVLRDRRSILERFAKLEETVKHSIDTFVKPPHFNRNQQPQLENKLLERGIRVCGIYENSWPDDPGIKPFMASWIAAGEEARTYPGTLPHKMIIFDSHDVLMPLIFPGDQMRALLVRHGQLAETLILAFELIWEKSKPVGIDAAAATSAPAGVVSRNGHSRLRRKKQLNP
jgi:sugar-specific transcriptional regulator TrmB